MKYGPSRFNAEIWFQPNKSARAAAEKALELNKSLPKSRRAGTPAGLARARSIVRGELQPAREVAGWFARHGPNIAMQRHSPKAKATIASGLWGGAAAAKQARDVLQKNAPRRNNKHIPPLFHGSAHHGLRKLKTPTGRDGWDVTRGEVIYLTDELKVARKYAGRAGVVYQVHAPYARKYADVRKEQQLGPKANKYLRGVWVTPPSLITKIEVIK